MSRGICWAVVAVRLRRDAVAYRAAGDVDAAADCERQAADADRRARVQGVERLARCKLASQVARGVFRVSAYGER